MSKLTLTLEGIIPSKKNSKRLVLAGGKTKVLSSSKYIAWENKQLWLLLRKKPNVPISRKCVITVKFSSRTQRLWDLSNKFESIADLLVRAGIIEDDNWKILSEVHLSFDDSVKEDIAEIQINY